VWTFATLTFRASFEGPDLRALVERCRQLHWTLAEGHGDPLITVDGEEIRDDDTHIVEHIERAKRSVQVTYGAYPQVLRTDAKRRTLQVGMPQVSIEMSVLAEQLATVPFEVAVFASPYVSDWGERVEGDPDASLGVGHESLGWAAAFRGPGYDRLVSRRWLDAGPWKVWRGPGDVTLIQFHALDVDRETALAQAAPGYRRFWVGDMSGQILPYLKDPQNPEATYEAATRTVRVPVAAGREVSDKEMLEWAAARVRKRDPRGPIDSVAFVFASDADARAHLPRLWPYEHQCWTTNRLDEGYVLPDPTPAWARGPAFDFAEVELGERVREGTGDAVYRGRAKRDGAPLLITVTTGHADDPARHAAEEALTVPGIAPLLGLGRVAGQAFADALAEIIPAGRPASELAPIEEPTLVRLARSLTQAVARVHAQVKVLDGIRPELIYVDDGGAFLALAPRGPRFIASATPVAAGPRSYPLPFVGHETLALGKPVGYAGDVFALCASVFVLGTGKHPFGEDLHQILQRMMAGDPQAWPGSARLGEILRKGLARNPTDRPHSLNLHGLFAALG
jgi:hypothetical protein